MAISERVRKAKGNIITARDKPLDISNYYKIAYSVGLNQDDAFRYVSFMIERFPEEKDVGYATEWAKRFKRGVEYNVADSESKRILEKVDKDILRAKIDSKINFGELMEELKELEPDYDEDEGD
jgi:hypothetical protein